MSCCEWLKSCYKHNIRYTALKILHGVEFLTYLVRFIVVCIDLSNTKLQQTNLSFSVAIFILEFFASIPILISNFVYAFLLCFPSTVLPKQKLRTYVYPRTLLRTSTMTCCACKCYHEHPAGMQLTRLAVLVICFLMRFVAFVLGSLCATKFNPICVPYAVLSSLSLIPSLIVLVIEVFHFHIIWNYQPSTSVMQLTKRARGFLRFFPFNMTYDARGREYGMRADDIGCTCDSVCLAHSILYHSATMLPKLPLPPLIDGKVIIAYHLTSTEKAEKIMEKGFPLGEKKQLADELVFNLHIPATAAGGTSDDLCSSLYGPRLASERGG